MPNDLRHQIENALRDTRPPRDPTAQASFGLHGDIRPEEIGFSVEMIQPAAVLVPLVERPAELTVLLTRRTEHLAQHAGQISFPGGRMEPQDTDLVTTALRETEEETGVTPQQVRIAGFLDPYLTVTGYAVTPIVGFVRPDITLKPDPFEVEEIFEVPLNFIFDTRNHVRESRDFRGRRVSYYAIQYGRHRIWGATAAMLVDFQRRVMRRQTLLRAAP